MAASQSLIKDCALCKSRSTEYMTSSEVVPEIRHVCTDFGWALVLRHFVWICMLRLFVAVSLTLISL